jgi:hypothetical protein
MLQLRPCIAFFTLLLAAAGPATAVEVEPEEASSSAQEPLNTPVLEGSRVEVLCLRLSRRLVIRALGDAIETTSPVHDVILGTRVRGTALTRGTVTVDLHPDPQAAALRLFFEGSTTARTVGRNGPAIIYSTGFTSFRSTKQIALDTDRGFLHQEANIISDTDLTTTGIGATVGGLRGELVRCVARRRTQRTQRRAEAIASRNARVRIRSSFDDYVSQRIARINQAVKAFEPLIVELRDTTQHKWQFSTSPDWLDATLNSFAPRRPGGRQEALGPWRLPRPHPSDDLAELWVQGERPISDRIALGNALSAAVRIWRTVAADVPAPRGDDTGSEAVEGISLVVHAHGDWTQFVLAERPDPTATRTAADSPSLPPE